MEAKEKVIAEKWIEAIGEENFKEVTLDADGVGSIPMELYYDNLGKFKLVTAYITTMIVIPKSLVGISNNNGWIRIESEKDIPTSSKLYKSGYLNPENGEWIEHRTKDTTEQLKTAYWAKCITHIKEITVDLPPLF